MGEIIGIHFPSVKIAMDLYGVEDQRVCLYKVNLVSNKIIELQREQQKNKQE